ncbi:MAG: Trk system potassium transporter TrkA [Rhodospirillaceae bacterium]|jgi:trk system potassium uptake protein|nr:Trk system potassium transporter TrkA [Rhodospirillaceae bacterium]MBT4464594.1 Trk system potassium transporter TrkA [Rhodospirillaceae bacterium]MBT5014120.1 Trk system potassium transporter TrkA [Rhodospirillaceae bacterium]MBT5307780.1 Trk system potassium transporter TrkA [Rhodospirillaceae bacterium]MBT7355622.1 Trk system potassium transporter TrkA [Rhodospirillaceae bacterium]
MKVIICGAGQVGSNIARHLSMESNDVTIVDKSNDLIRQISDSIDVRGIVGHASRPDILEQAGIADADMIIAVTYTDEVNMVACQIAHSLFGVPTKIARIRHQSYLQPIWANLFSREHMPIDVIISPEIEIARAVTRRLQVPGAFEMIPLVEDKVRLLGVRCGDDCPLVHTPLRQLTQLFPDLNIVIVGLLRDGEAIVPTGNDHMIPGDEVYFVVDTEHLPRAMAAFGHEETEARRLLIFGGGNIGLFLAQQVEAEHPWVKTKIIEGNKERAEEIAGILDNTIVLNGDVLDPEILEEANVAATETVVAVTNDDETNILSSLLAKSHGSGRAITLMNKASYQSLVAPLGIDVVVSPRNITVSTILQHVRRGRIHSVHTLREGFGELIEAEALETSPLINTPLKEVNLPTGVLLGAIVRGTEIIVPRGNTIVEAGDRIVLFAAAEAVSKVEKMFSVQLEYF